MTTDNEDMPGRSRYRAELAEVNGIARDDSKPAHVVVERVGMAVHPVWFRSTAEALAHTLREYRPSSR